MPRHVKGDLHQIGSSVPGEGGWLEAVRVYVLLNDGCPLVFDAGSHLHRTEVMADLRTLLGDVPPGYVFLTHSQWNVPPPTRLRSGPRLRRHASVG